MSKMEQLRLYRTGEMQSGKELDLDCLEIRVSRILDHYQVEQDTINLMTYEVTAMIRGYVHPTTRNPRYQLQVFNITAHIILSIFYQ